MRKKKILPLRCQNWMEKPGVERKKKKINREDEATTESFLVAARRQQAHWTWRLKTASNCCPKTLAGFNFSEADVFVL